ncbi:MAG: protease inhibitor I42 family protein [Bacteroidales bacterium]|jgi:predicted secreted protein
MKKRLMIAILTAFTFVFLLNSCKKEADYVLQVGESFCLELYEYPSSGMTWEWENQDNNGIVSMKKITFTSTNPEPPLVDSTDIVLGGGTTAHYCFKGEGKGYVVVKMAIGKEDDPDRYRRLNFSIRVE